MTTKPSFEASGAALRQALPAMMAMNPALFWLDVWRQTTEPWLADQPHAFRIALP
jgi:hypothetical protein